MDIAIIGMAGRFPDAAGIDAFYENLRNGKDCVGIISRKRLKNTSCSLLAAYRNMAFLEDIDLFDHDFFNISLGEAIYMDPQQRLSMEVAYQTFENAGYNIDFFNGSNTSIYIGDTFVNYYKLAETADPTLLTGNMNAALAGRIARFFNLRGKAMMVDTACSSSLVALHLAYNDLVHGESDYALVGGVRLCIFPFEQTDGNEVGILSPDGKARSFADGANGTGIGEAVGFVLLKSLEKALKDQDIIHAIVKGTAVNQDAALSGSLTSPSAVAQAEVIASAWKRAGVEPRTIGYVEAHGTGTKLGDPIEIQGLDQAFKRFTDDRQFCAVSAVKSNIGHTDSAAGIVGLIKAVLSLKFRELFPSLHFNAPNPFIDFDNSAVYINASLTPWKTTKGAVRRAGVSAFGLSGTNCHVILEEAAVRTADPGTPRAPHYLIPISGKNEQSLLANIRLLKQFLDAGGSVSLADLSYTLCQGRKHYAHRFAVVVNSLQELQQSFAHPEESELYRVTGRIDKTIFVFSHEIGVTAAMMERFGAGEPACKTAYLQCLKSASGKQETAHFLAFAFQYCFYQVLLAKGIKGDVFLGEGIGRLVVDVLSGQLSLEAGIAAALAHKSELEPGTLTSKCLALFDKLKQDRLLFVEVGPKGNLTRELRQCNTSGRNIFVQNTVHAANSSGEYAHFLRDVYLAGYPLDWEKAMGETGGQRVELPLYAFNRKRCWLKSPSRSEVEKWLYATEWVKSPLSPLLEKKKPGLRFLLVFRNSSLTDQLAESLSEVGCHCIKVCLGNDFRQLDEQSFEINFRRESDYEALYTLLQQQHLLFDGIIHLENFTDPTDITSENLEENLTYGLYPQLFFAKVLQKELSKYGFRYITITTNAYKVLSGEAARNPVGVMMGTFTRSILADCPGLKINAIDLDNREGSGESLVGKINQEIWNEDTIRSVCYRDGERYVQQLSPLLPAGKEQKPGDWLEENGTYLITGGLGTIGTAIGQYIAGRVSCRLLLLGRTVLPPKEQWNYLPTTSEYASKVMALKELEKLGTQVDYYAVDVADERGMKETFADIGRRFPKIKGVIHAAGIGIRETTLGDLPFEQFKETLRPKTLGTLMLEEYCRELEYDFFVITSSLNAVVPLRNSVDYAVANAFEDAFAAGHIAEKGIISINWPGWVEPSFQAEASTGIMQRRGALKAIDVEEGLEALDLILRNGCPNVLVAPVDWSTFAVNPYFLVAPPPAGSAGGEATRKDEPQRLPIMASEEALTPIESSVIAIWKEVLKASSVKKSDDFFELGGHSLIGSQVLSRIGKQFGVEMEFDVLFDYPTAEGLAAHLGHLLGSNGEVKQEAVMPVEEQDYYRLSHAQQRIWILSQMDQTAYNMSFAYEVTGQVDQLALQLSCNMLLEQHEILRTTVALVGGQPYQKVHPPLPLSVRNETVRGAAGGEQRVNQILSEGANHLFDLQLELPLRILQVEVEENRHIWLLVIHHIAADGWSVEVLLEQLISLYNAHCRGEKPRLQPLSFQYKDFTARQNQKLTDEQVQSLKAYWLEQFRGPLPVLPLPADFPRPPVKSYRGASLAFALDGNTTEDWRAFCQAKGLTVFMAFVACVKVLLFRYTGVSDIVVGTPVSNRDQEELEKQIGLYLNTLAIRTRFLPDDDFLMVAHQVKTRYLNALEHRAYPFERLVDDLKAKRDMSRSPVFDVTVESLSLSVLNNEALELDGLSVKSWPLQFTTSKFDLSFKIVEAQDAIPFVIEYSTDLFTKATVEQIGQHLKHLMLTILRESRLPVNKISFLREAEARQLLREFNATQTALPAEDTIVSLFTRQASQHPGQLALLSRGRRFTYQQLEEQSNQLARYLQEHWQVRVGDLVGLMSARNQELVIGLMAILKSGGVYLPLDASLPPARLGYLLEDTGARVFLVSEPGLLETSLREDSRACYLSDCWERVSQYPSQGEDWEVTAEQSAYVIYTSGSTGKPKGVVVTHANFVNFYVGMNQALSLDPTDHLLAMTSPSFDISLLELVWTLCRGVCVSLAAEPYEIYTTDLPQSEGIGKIDFSLFYFASQHADTGAQKYKLLFDTATFADTNGFAAIWLPERHFHDFGGIYPNPSVTGAAVAAKTERIKIRAGSVVLPLHDVVRVAEEWSVVDNISQGRVELSIAPGWHPNDFLFFPADFRGRHAKMYRQLDELKKLWAGEPIIRKNGLGEDFEVKIYPRPVQDRLPLWITSTGNADTFYTAGKMGLSVLTHLLGQDLEELARKINIYKNALIRHGHPVDKASVAVMLHTYLGRDLAAVKEEVARPFKSYLQSNIGLLGNLLKNSKPNQSPETTPAVMAELLDLAFERYWQSAALLGTPESCRQMLEKLSTIGVTEVACLIDFGIPAGKVMESLRILSELRPEYALPRHPVSRTDTVTSFQTTPSLLGLLLEDPRLASFFKGLRHIMIGGEKLSEDLVAKLRGKTSATFYNMYGPTETTIWSTTACLDHPQTPLTVGKPIANTQIYVLDEWHNLLPFNVVGEVYIGGAGVAAGYLNQPELTSERFLTNPFAQDGSRLYRTGDLGKWLPDARLQILGRTDQQVKHKGHRIELSEIEYALQERVKQAVVLLVENGTGGTELVAYYTTGESSPAALRTHLESSLPLYMIPSHFVEIPSFPLTSNGKVDRKALLSQTLIQKSLQEYTAPGSDTEARLKRLWRELLGREQIGVCDDFFEIGGHSLLATRLVGRILETFGAEVKLKDIFLSPTIRQLALVIEQSEKRSYQQIQPLEEQLYYSTSHAQQRLWLQYQLQEKSSYNETIAYWLEGELDREAIEQALFAVLRRHEILRTSFLLKDGELKQRVHEFRQGPEAFDYEEMATECVTEESARYLAGQELVKPFDLSRPPLFRAKLVRASMDKYIFIFTIHHIVSDDLSLAVISREIISLYNAYHRNEKKFLPPLPVHYKDYVAWQHRALSSQSMQLHREYWLTVFNQGVPQLKWKKAGSYPSQGALGEKLNLHLPQQVYEPLLTLSREHNLTMFMTLLTGVQLMLYKYSEQNDIVVCTSIANREHPDLENQVGLYLNQLPLFVRIESDEKLAQLLAKVKNNTLEAYEHRLYPFNYLVKELNLRRNEVQPAFLNVMVDFENIKRGENLEMEGVEVRNLEVGFPNNRVDIAFNFGELDGQIKGWVVYNTGIFSRSTLEEMLFCLHHILTSMSQCVDASVGELMEAVDEKLVLEKKKKKIAQFGRNLEKLKSIR